MKRELLPWEKTVISRLGATDPERGSRLIKYLTEETEIVGGRLVTASTTAINEKD